MQPSGRITDDWQLSPDEIENHSELAEVIEKQGQFFVINSTVFWQVKESGISGRRFTLGFYPRRIGQNVAT